MKEKLSEENTTLLKDTIEMHKMSTAILKDWRKKLMNKCKDCISRKEDDMNGGINWKCDCDVQFFLDLITELIKGNGGY